MPQLATKIKAYLSTKGKTESEIELLIDDRTKILIMNLSGTDELKLWNVDGISEPTTSELDALEPQALAIENNLTILKNRKQAYPSWREQLDYIYHNGIDKWKSDIVDPVKAKYPKSS
tara:strand:- start:774 stop:1127 length:354 start_codon:yes stop_codon:yes gene_type:complete